MKRVFKKCIVPLIIMCIFCSVPFSASMASDIDPEEQLTGTSAEVTVRTDFAMEQTEKEDSGKNTSSDEEQTTGRKKVKNGWVINSKGYKYYYKNGKKLTGLNKIDGETYYFLESGRMKTKWATINGRRYYFAPEDGTMTKGIKKIGRFTFYFDKKGRMTTGIKKIAGKRYYFKESGAHTGAKVYGFRTVNGNTYYFYKKDDGAAVMGMAQINQELYLFGTKSAQMAKGWRNYRGYRYYFDPESGQAVKGWNEIDNKKFFFNDDRTLKTGWLKQDDNWFYLTKEDGMVTGWRKVGDSWYWFEKTGVMVSSTTRSIDNIDYVFNASGACINPGDASRMKEMLKKAQKYSSKTSNLILIDCTQNRIGVFSGEEGEWETEKFWMCSTGKKDTPTVKGEFEIYGNRGYSFGTDEYTCYWYSGFYKDFLIHSVTYYAGTKKIKNGTLGKNLSNGCVRLDIKNAKWIYDNIDIGTKVVTY